FDLIGDRATEAHVLVELDASIVCGLIEPMDLDRVVSICDEIGADDLADILGYLDNDKSSAILEGMADQESLEIEDLLGYDPESAGGIMSPEFFALQRDTTIGQAITALQEQSEDLEMAFYIYVINEHGKLVGVLSLRQLVTTRPDRLVSEVMASDVVTVPVHADQEEVANVVALYNFLAVPVVDETNRLIGIVTVDDIIDVLYDEATEDILMLAGVGAGADAQAGALQHLRMRYPWLIASCVGGFGAAIIMDPFLETLGLFLGLFVPIVMGMAGNVGIQSSTVVVRALATGQMTSADSSQVIRREVLIGVLMGCGYGTVVGLAAAGYSWLNGAGVDFLHIAVYGSSVGLALGAAMIIAATLGTMIPIGLNKLGVDPAVATGPFVTTALDILGILSYFGIAILLSGFLPGG
ncbi:MAG: magnesium transporter, partial [Myxococcota bacterium]